jgi:hypothetical protein
LTHPGENPSEDGRLILPVRFQWWMESPTAASSQVIEELMRALFLNARDRQLSMGDPMEKVLRCPNVFASCHPLITTLGKFF